MRQLFKYLKRPPQSSGVPLNGEKAAVTLEKPLCLPTLEVGKETETLTSLPSQ